MKILLSLGALGLALFGLVHQRFVIDAGWFDWSQIHHESLIAIAVCVGVALLVVYIIDRR